MSKNVIFHEEARQRLKKGIDKVANAVRVTLGPRGRNVVLDKGFGAPTITNDGVTIAKEITLDNKFENMGAEIIKEVAEKTNTIAGDGTSTATILAHAIMTEGLKRTTLGANAMVIREGIEAAARDAVTELMKMATPVRGDDIERVASIAAESDELGKIIADTIEKVGKDGVVTVEESRTTGLSSEVVEGLEFDKGFVSPYMVTDSERMEAVYEDASVLVTDQKISSAKDILPLLEGMAQKGKKELVIIADDVEGEALATFVVNKLRGGFNVLAVKAPGFGDAKKDRLQDIATVVGAEVISEDRGQSLENATEAMLGSASKVIASDDKTIIIDGGGLKKDIEARAEQIRAQADHADSNYAKEKLEKRAAALTGGVAVIRVGAATETEMKYLKLKIEDAVNATKAAIEEGVVDGGGAALVKVGKKLSDKLEKMDANDDHKIGYQILTRALDAPLKQIVENAGNDEPSAILHAVRIGKRGYDAKQDMIVDNISAAGIIDPAKVARTGIENAASAAAILLTTEAAVADDPDNEDEKGGGMPGGMG
ncbi:MAG: chaperonin GroEL, partial [Candidatus Paceibacterota bacterium]